VTALCRPASSTQRSNGAFKPFETWLIPNSKPIVAEAKMPEDPAVEEARLYVGDLTDDRDELRRQLNDLKSMVQPEYEDAYKQFFEDFNRWQEELNEKLDTTLPALGDEITHPTTGTLSRRRLSDSKPYGTGK